MRNHSPELLVAAQTELGECPVWDESRGQFYFMDIIEMKLHAFDWAKRTLSSRSLPALGGGLALARDGTLIAGLQTGVYRVQPDEAEIEFMADPEPNKPDHRLNEMKCDPQGRIWIGSISTLGRVPTGCLYRLDHNRTIQRILDKVAVPNTLVWLADSEHLLFADSARKVVWRFRYEAESGSLSQREVFLDCNDYVGIPDGAALDAEGCVWIAEFGGGCVRRYDPNGRVIQRVDLPATQVTSCGFAGPRLRELVIITTKRLLTSEQRRQQPQSGNLFVIEPAVPGIAPFLYGRRDDSHR